MKVHFVRSEEGDWIGLYINGELRAEGHSLDEREIAEQIAEALKESGLGPEIAVTSEERSTAWFDENGGSCPPRLEG